MRQYQPIWSELKKHKVVSITANRLFHPRIIKAVVKEKWLDLGYKITLAPQTAILSHETKGAILTFYLEIKEAKITPYALGLIDTINNTNTSITSLNSIEQTQLNQQEPVTKTQKYADLILKYLTRPEKFYD